MCVCVGGGGGSRQPVPPLDPPMYNKPPHTTNKANPYKEDYNIYSCKNCAVEVEAYGPNCVAKAYGAITLETITGFFFQRTI